MSSKLLNYRSTYLPLVALFVVLELFLILPLLRELGSTRLWQVIWGWSEDGWAIPVLRSIVFAVVSSILTVPTAFLAAVAVRNVGLSLSRVFSLALLPALLGSVAVAFSAKLFVMQWPLMQALVGAREWFPTWGSMLLVQGIQFGPLFTYLFFLSLRNIQTAPLDFATVSHLTSWEKLREVYWPDSRNLAALLTLFAMIEGLQEYSKFYLILHASAGTDMELASHRLLRYYTYYAPADPALATHVVLAISGIFVLFGIAATALTVPFTVGTIDRLVIALGKLGGPSSETRRFLSMAIAGLLLVVSFSPLLAVAPYLFVGRWITLEAFIRSIEFTGVTTLIVTALAICFGVASRLAFPERLERFGRQSLVILLALYMTLVLPPIAIAFCGFDWISLLGGGLRSSMLVLTVWVIGQIVLAFPIVSSFVLVTHFRLKTSEIQFQEISKASPMEVLHFSFWKRFRADYALIALFAFSLVWNEGTLSSIISGLSRDVPSVAVRLLERVDGRAASYNESANLMLISLVPVLPVLLLWTHMTRKYFAGRG